MDVISSALLLGQFSTSFERQAKMMIQAAEENVARIDSQMRDLMRIQNQERGLIIALKQVVAPIRKLPAELVVEIFTHSLSPSFSIKSVLVICQVCAYWRQLAQTTPKLWTALLRLNLRKPASDAYVAMAKTFLERSTPLPIPIAMDYTESCALPLVEVVLSMASRWKSASLYNFPLPKLRELPFGALESLETVSLTSRRQILTYEQKTTAFLGACRLRSVIFDGRSISHFPMPWAQLTELTIRENSCQICLDILLQCMNLITAEFSDMPSWVQSPPSAPTTVLPRLETLEVGFAPSDGNHIMSFFMRLDLPALTSLDVRVDLDNLWSGADFAQFQRRSPNIQHLAMRCCSDSFSPPDMTSILLAAPHLITLELDLCMYCIDDTVIELLRFSPNQAVSVVPRLQNLDIQYANTDMFQESLLEDVIKSRWWSDAELLTLPLPPPVARWKFVHIYTDDDGDFSQRFRLSMDRLRKQGLDVDIN
ncbi:hypothetical protein DFH06DRAFT_734822 [Mycena polygramma]|nr:hypothetical protein DFH06DRAFT_734822 [Mycena polygramma]